MFRGITIISILQLALVTLGYVGVGIVLKISGYPDAPLIKWNPVAVWIRHRGGWLYLLPVLWTSNSLICMHLDRGIFKEWISATIGAFSISALLVVFAYAMFFSHSWRHVYSL